MDETNHEDVPLHQNRRIVLILLFFVMGPLALRLLWTSPQFTQTERLAFSVLSILEFMVLAYLFSRGYASYLLGIGADGPT